MAVPLCFMACAPKVKIVTVEVQIPVPVPCPQPPELTIPPLEIQKLDPNSPPDQVAKTAVMDIQSLHTRLKQAIKALDSYRVPPVKEPK